MSDALKQFEEESIHHEHTMQIRMIDLLRKPDGSADSHKTSILDQLIAYTDVHFMSEQLVMRQHSYDGYDAHCSDHDELMSRLQVLAEIAHEDKGALDSAAIEKLRTGLLTHIGTHDRKLSEFLRAS